MNKLLHILNATFLFLFLCVAIGSASAQQTTVTGTVVSSTDKQPLPGVTVLEKGTSNGVMADLEGRFSIKVSNPNATLLISFIGFQNMSLPLNGQTALKVELKESVSELEQVVVVAYGTQRKSDMTGAIASVKTKDIAKISSFNAEQALQGQVAGVQVTTTSGAPGAMASIRVRGVGTFNSSAPIFVVDGVILDDISFLNPNDIASMNVLKDASATAIYGSRGANGVILITTKTGNAADGKTNFSYSGEYGVQILAKKIKLLTGRQFGEVANSIRAGSYNNLDVLPNTDWQDQVFHAASVHNHSLSVSGTNGKNQYYASLGYYKQDGIIDKSKFERVTLKLNNTYSLTDFLKFGNNITLSPFSQQNAADVTYAVYRAQPVIKPYYADGSYSAVPNVGNPLASTEYSNDFRKGIRGVGNLFAETNYAGFTFKTSFGIDGSYEKSENFAPAYTIYNEDGSASQQQNVLSRLSKGYGDNLTWLWENTLNYKKEINKHAFDALVGYTMQNTASENVGMSGQNIIRNGSDFWYVNPSNIVDVSNNVNTVNSIYNNVDAGRNYSMLSYLFRLNYSYDSKYLLTATYRSDGSSKFSKNNRFAKFPSLAAGWNISNEDFLHNHPFITNMKVRASWGKIGNEKIDYLAQYSTVNSGLLAVFGKNDGSNAAATYAKSGNPDLKWETTTQADLGLELGFFKNRLTSELDYFHRQTDDILIQLSTPGHLGNGQGAKITYNAASVLNTGYEFKVNWKDKLGELSYNIGMIGSVIHNEVLAIGGNSGIDSVLMGGYLGNGIPVTQSRVGLAIGSFYGYKTNGIFQNQAELNAYPHLSDAGVGDLRFVDVNGDHVLDGKDRTNLGSPIPSFVFGLNLELEYKNFDFTLDLQGQTGNKIFNAKEAVRPDPYNFEAHVANFWHGEGTSNSEPRASWGGYNYTPSDRFVQDGSFIRLRTVGVGYTLPAAISKKIKVNQMRIYLKGTNVYTLSKFTGYTPEIGSGDVISNGMDTGSYPITAVYSCGINLTF